MAANTLFHFFGSAVVDYDQEFLPLANVSGAIIFTVFPATVAVLLHAGLLSRSTSGLVLWLVGVLLVVSQRRLPVTQIACVTDTPGRSSPGRVLFVDANEAGKELPRAGRIGERGQVSDGR